MFSFKHTHLAIMLSCLVSLSANAALVHDYQLNGNLSDALGGPDAISEGGTLDANGYRFGENEGLTFSGLGLGLEYSIATRFSFDLVDSWRKIIDFKNLTSDFGLYNWSSRSRFFGPGEFGAVGDFAAGELSELVLTRTLAGIVQVYIDGVSSITFDDAASEYSVVDASEILRLFQDDLDTGDEASAGYVDYVRIYDTAIVPGVSVPEPAAWALLLLGAPLLRLRLRKAPRAA